MNAKYHCGDAGPQGKPGEQGPIGAPSSPEMSLRDYFAGKVINSIVVGTSINVSYLTAARESYLLADAMLKAREETS